MEKDLAKVCFFVKRSFFAHFLLQNPDKYSFKSIIKANIGDAHAMGQMPITFIRQVLVCITQPELMDKIDFPDDVKKQARTFLASCSGKSIGMLL